MKKIPLLVALTLLLTLINSSTLLAQHRVPSAYAADYARMQQQLNLQRMHGTMQPTVFAGLLIFSIIQNELYNPETAYLVILKDSTKRQILSKINLDEKKGTYLEVLTNKKTNGSSSAPERIYPSDTYSIEAIDPFGHDPSYGIPVDNCWLFNEVKGPINGFTFMPKPKSGKMDSGYFRYVQKGDGPLVECTKENVMEMVKDYQNLVAMANGNKLYEAIVAFNKAEKKKNKANQ